MKLKAIFAIGCFAFLAATMQAQTTQFKRVTPPANAKEIVRPSTGAKSPTNAGGKQVVLKPENALTPPAATLATYPSATKSPGDAKKSEPAAQKYVLRKSKNLKTGETTMKEYVKKEDFDAARKGDFSKAEDAKKH